MNPPSDNIGRILVGLKADPSTAKIHLAYRSLATGQLEYTEDRMKIFAWVDDSLVEDESIGALPRQELAGAGALRHRIEVEEPEQMEALLQARRNPVHMELIRPLEHQYLLQHQTRMIAPGFIKDVLRCQIDIETDCEREGGFSQSGRSGDRILAVGIGCAGRFQILELQDHTDEAEMDLLRKTSQKIQELDPDILEGHNFFNFDLTYLRARYKRYRLPMDWGRFGMKPVFRNSRVRIAERWVDINRCDIPGRTVFDTLLAAQFYDLTERSLPSFGLKDLARHFRLATANPGERTYVDGDAIGKTFREDRPRFRAYLEDDLKETEGIASVMLPSYLAQAAVFPMMLQEILLRGTGGKVESVFLEKYALADRALPALPQFHTFEGAFSKGFDSGVFEKVLHYDVASLYPSLLLLIDRSPAGDDLGCMIPILRELREERLVYKKKAKEDPSPAFRQEYAARQSSFKILINSFYGYLGFSGARFGDSELASEVTAGGRKILQQLIDDFRANGCHVLEADTDGLYVQAGDWFDQPDELLRKVCENVPDGIDLEWGGSYDAMFCYKAKNYALRVGDTILIKGSALRARSMEPYLRELTDLLIGWLLGKEKISPMERISELRTLLEEQTVPVEKLAKGEYLSQHPEAYRRAVEEKGKPRRAALEVALRMNPIPRMGEKVSYFITPGERKSDPDWKRARPIKEYDSLTQPYDPGHYQSRIENWLKRYGEFLPKE